MVYCFNKLFLNQLIWRFHFEKEAAVNLVGGGSSICDIANISRKHLDMLAYD